MNSSSLSSKYSKEIFINYLTKKGLKNTSEKIFKKSLKDIQRRTKKNSKIIIKLSLKYVYPVISFINKPLKNSKIHDNKVICKMNQQIP